MTVSPRATVSVSGTNFIPSMITVWVIDGSAANPYPAYEKRNASISDPAIAPLTAAFDESGSFILLAQRPLNMFGVVQMRDECRPHFNQQRFQFVILALGMSVLSSASSTVW